MGEVFSFRESFFTHYQDTTSLDTNKILTLPDTAKDGKIERKIESSNKEKLSKNIQKAVVADTNECIDTSHYFEQYNNDLPIYSYLRNNLSPTTSLYSSHQLKTKVKPNEVIIFNNKKSSQRIIPEPKNIPHANESFFFLLLVAGLFFLSVIIKHYQKFVNQIFRGFIYKFVSIKNIQEKSIPFNRFRLNLDILFFLSTSMIIYYFLTEKVGLEFFDVSYLFQLAILFLCLLSYRVFKYIFHKTLMLIIGNSIFINDLFQTSLLYFRILGIINTPLVFLMVYSVESISTYTLYLIISLFIAAIVIKTWRTIKLFVDNGFSIFYFILYICALEIIPLFIIWKELN